MLGLFHASRFYLSSDCGRERHGSGRQESIGAFVGTGCGPAANRGSCPLLGYTAEHWPMERLHRRAARNERSTSRNDVQPTNT